jgi:hypothetical protein
MINGNQKNRLVARNTIVIDGKKVFIPNNYTTSRTVTRTRYVPGPAPAAGHFEYYTEQSTEVPKNFLDSHSIGNYGWIFDGSILNGAPGYVTPK